MTTVSNMTSAFIPHCYGRRSSRLMAKTIAAATDEVLDGAQLLLLLRSSAVAVELPQQSTTAAVAAAANETTEPATDSHDLQANNSFVITELSLLLLELSRSSKPLRRSPRLLAMSLRTETVVTEKPSPIKKTKKTTFVEKPTKISLPPTTTTKKMTKPRTAELVPHPTKSPHNAQKKSTRSRKQPKAPQATTSPKPVLRSILRPSKYGPPKVNHALIEKADANAKQLGDWETSPLTCPDLPFGREAKYYIQLNSKWKLKMTKGDDDEKRDDDDDDDSPFAPPAMDVLTLRCHLPHQLLKDTVTLETFEMQFNEDGVDELVNSYSKQQALSRYFRRIADGRGTKRRGVKRIRFTSRRRFQEHY